MRRNFEAYADFYSYLVKAIVGKRNFKKRLRTMAEGVEIATVSDEALALLAAENSRHVWDDIFDKSDGQIRQIRNDETYPKEWMSDELPKYTRASKDDPSVEESTEDKKWSTAGIERFNALRELVKADRVNYPNFRIKWLRDAREQLKSTESSNVDEEAPVNVVEATNDFDQLTEKHPSLNEAANQEGVANASGDETEEEEEEDGEVEELP